MKDTAGFVNLSQFPSKQMTYCSQPQGVLWSGRCQPHPPHCKCSPQHPPMPHCAGSDGLDHHHWLMQEDAKKKCIMVWQGHKNNKFGQKYCIFPSSSTVFMQLHITVAILSWLLQHLCVCQAVSKSHVRRHTDHCLYNEWTDDMTSIFTLLFHLLCGIFCSCDKATKTPCLVTEPAWLQH